MSTRRLVIAAIVVALGTAAAAAVLVLVAKSGSSNDAELNAAKTAFTERGVQFSFTVGPDQWRALRESSVGSDIPERFRANTVGYAVSFKHPEFRIVTVFDAFSSAVRYAQFLRKRSIVPAAVTLVARNVVYYGWNDKLARQAMASLRNEARK